MHSSTQKAKAKLNKLVDSCHEVDKLAQTNNDLRIVLEEFDLTMEQLQAQQSKTLFLLSDAKTEAESLRSQVSDLESDNGLLKLEIHRLRLAFLKQDSLNFRKEMLQQPQTLEMRNDAESNSGFENNTPFTSGQSRQAQNCDLQNHENIEACFVRAFDPAFTYYQPKKKRRQTIKGKPTPFH